MTSEENKVGQKLSSEENKECESVLSKRGVCLLGYTLPWWIVVVVLVLVLYVAYDRNMLASVGLPKVERVLSIGGTYNLEKYRVPMTPAGYKALFNM